MSNFHLTGSNQVPVSSRRRDDNTNEISTQKPLKRTFDYENEPKVSVKSESGFRLLTEGVDSKKEEPRKRRSRWGDDKINIGLPTTLPVGFTPEQTEMYSVTFRLEEIGMKLRTGNVVPPDGQRSPSPEPTYGADGKRTNTRDLRYRKKLEDERHRLVEKATRLIPGYKPPPDYKKPSKTSEKLLIPAKDHPEINFIGLLIGPRGNTLKKMETDSGAKISIRGKGSVKEGKVRNDGGLAPGEEEDLHCLITADSEDKVKKAASNVPEGQNELKRAQLRELASLNGTLRDDENQVCTNCGNSGHWKYDCPEQKNFTNNLICRICNGAGHTARDCMQRSNPEAINAARQRDEQLDNEYANLMAELGESTAGASLSVYGPQRPRPPMGMPVPPWPVTGIPGSDLPISHWPPIPPPGLSMPPGVPGMSVGPPGTPGIASPPPGISGHPPGIPPPVPGAWSASWNPYGPPPGPHVPALTPGYYGGYSFGAPLQQPPSFIPPPPEQVFIPPPPDHILPPTE
ncbi:hypothetical protein HK096_003704 [Nowakowskiella sp. JEL0078]|nr:hypothetical protein HK096_003704 [Nowakowskiella sp. JEL0078]